MKFAKTSGALGLAALAATASPLAQADELGWYLGANAGQSQATIDDEGITRGLLGAGFTTRSISEDDRDTGYKVFAGYRVSRHFAVEGGYFDLGQFGFTAVTTPAGTLTGDIRLRGVNLDLVGFLPLSERFSAFARAGVNYAEARDTFTGTGAVNVLDPNPSARGTHIKYGAGLQFDFSPSLAMRAEAERYRIDDAVGNKGDIDLVSVGLVYRFGRETAYVAPAPAATYPQPLPAPVAAPPEPIRATFSADSLFDFDRETVKAAGRADLEQFAANLRGMDYNVVTVTGHTDRLGSHAYNMALSQRRADAVKSFLVESGGIPAEKINANGVNGANPVTRPGDCVGTRATPELIACLQPDRRVEVEVTGTK